MVTSTFTYSEKNTPVWAAYIELHQGLEAQAPHRAGTGSSKRNDLRTVLPPTASTNGQSRANFRTIEVIKGSTSASNSADAVVGASARGKNAAFPLLRPALADRCRSPQGSLPTMRVQLRGYSSAPTFRVHSRRYRSCECRHVHQVPARVAPAFVRLPF